MTDNNYKTQKDKTVISEEVLTSIAGTTALEIEGVSSLAKRDDIKRLFNAKNLAKSVRVENREEQTAVNIYINLCKNAHVQRTAEKVQEAVKNALQSMTGRIISCVNVHIANIEVDKKEDI